MLHTSNYSSLRRLTPNAYTVRISVTQPSWAKTDDALPVLYPPADLLRGYKEGRVTEDEYTRRYLAHLNAHSDEVVRSLDALRERAAGRTPVLLCWCGKTAFCHRRIFASWWEHLTNEEVTEI